MTDTEVNAAEELSTATTIAVDAYISPEYARAERDLLWRKTWQQVGRVEELPEVGSYLSYDILDDSILVVRTGANEFAAHHNVCMHRGRRLIDVPEGAKNAKQKVLLIALCSLDLRADRAPKRGSGLGVLGGLGYLAFRRGWR